jgi:serralysin
MARRHFFSLQQLLAAGVIVLACSNQARAYDIVNRWGATQVDGGGLQRGDPVTLRWSIVPDGQSYSRSSNSQLIQYLDDGWNVRAAQRVPDLTGRSWWNVMNTAYQQFGRVSGVNMVYVAEQNANGTDAGMEGDIRIGGENIDGTPGGALADNTFPNDGDMRIDTTRESDGRPTFWHTNNAALRNLMIHETGHGVGLGHAQNTGVAAIMEGGLRTDIWGLQFDDVYALNRQYGDPLERNGGNNAAGTATSLGNVTLGGSVSVGRDAVDSVVQQFDDEWVGIDGSNDMDWFKFTTTAPGFANIKLTPIGPSYTSVQQGAFNAAAQSDLILQLFSESPSLSLLETANKTAVSGTESIGARYLATPATYLIRVRGATDFNQFYQLDLALNAAPAAGISADLNLDGAANIADWAIFVSNSYATLDGLGQLDAFQRGDLDFDGDNDVADFRFFKSAYIDVNGADAFANLFGVPEPSSILMAGIVAACCGVGCRRAKPQAANFGPLLLARRRMA